MTFPRIRLHNKILLALVFGAIFGVLFNISKYKLEITYADATNALVEEVVADWSSIELLNTETRQVNATFGPSDQLKILPFFAHLTKAEKNKTAVLVSFASSTPRRFDRVDSIVSGDAVVAVIMAKQEGILKTTNPETV